jgi:hypothetical protein
MTITTIKLKKETKERLDHLKEYRRESYEDIIKKILGILNILKSEPVKARGILYRINLKRKKLAKETSA